MKRNLLVVFVVLLISIFTLSLANLPKTQSAQRSAKERQQSFGYAPTETPSPYSSPSPSPYSSPSPSPESSPSPELSPSPSPEPSPEQCIEEDNETLEQEMRLAGEFNNNFEFPEVEATPEPSPEATPSPEPTPNPCEQLRRDLEFKKREVDLKRRWYEMAQRRYDYVVNEMPKEYKTIYDFLAAEEWLETTKAELSRLVNEQKELEAKISACEAKKSGNNKAECQANLNALRAQVSQAYADLYKANADYWRARRKQRLAEDRRRRVGDFPGCLQSDINQLKLLADTLELELDRKRDAYNSLVATLQSRFHDCDAL